MTTIAVPSNMLQLPATSPLSRLSLRPHIR
jgi:hypothetical protein